MRINTMLNQFDSREFRPLIERPVRSSSVLYLASVSVRSCLLVALVLAAVSFAGTASADPCDVPDAGGTVSLPPETL